MQKKPWSREEFKQQLLAKEKYYHIHHPLHKQMSTGKCNKKQIQAWVLNRFYYQLKIPQKDAHILANCDDIVVRQHWIQRILDHDGHGDQKGGIEAWVQLGHACGLSSKKIHSLNAVLPSVRFAVDAYVTFAMKASWQEAACSSLTEMFAPNIHQNRLDNWPKHYSWIELDGYHYFRNRLSQARRDVENGLTITLDYFSSYEQQQHALRILQFKLDVLWFISDAIYLAFFYNQPPYKDC
jgi:pyrroloquinoline-quinone synthase